MKAAARKRLEASVAGLKSAKQEREDAIVNAWLDGDGSIREIAETTGMSNAGISDMLERRKVRKRLTRAEANELQRAYYRDRTSGPDRL